MRNRIDSTFVRLRQAGRSGFMAYITGGDPDLDTTAAVARELAEAGTDFLEVGIPFSDPLADGLANQLGAQRALAAGVTVRKLLGCVAKIRAAIPTPIILYTYLNPVFQYGFARFENDAADAGADGLLLLDLPPDETSLEDSGVRRLHRIRLVAPTTDDRRVRTICARASGFIYYVSREGVTGERSELESSIQDRLNVIRNCTELPVAVGFGISNPAQAAAVAKVADAVVVGSAIVRRIGEGAGRADLAREIGRFVRPLAEAVHSARDESRVVDRA
ncbi:MAG: tryptophan synthase subunit alpha [Verrucomicrobia bacterium]|nr:tryptophan synthase subunit alpha [Verrucomicrobiota bacterium]